MSNVGVACVLLAEVAAVIVLGPMLSEWLMGVQD